MSEIIITSKCETCMYGTVDDTDKRKVTVYCSDKNKTFIFGQCINCENFSKKIV